ncbi:YopT-type cysteine protease domain-containing protein [Roseococcus sp.]|uniref:YopT-type cysteine protease domain-containing protein n=1 Tax=Roseococcus sp. TaxID=2109646 RepID=UPI003BAC9273
MADEMKTAAIAAKATFTARPGQMKLLQNVAALREVAGGASGICYGLAWVWMEAKAKGQTDALWGALGSNQEKPNTLKAARIYSVTQRLADKHDQSAALCQMKVARDAEDEHKTRNDLRCSLPQDMLTLATWMAAAKGTRYFLIETGERGHAMAGAGSKFGNLEFYDPNFGVVSCFKATTMAKFFSAYFAKERIKDAYFVSPKFALDVIKVKTA